MPEPEPSPPLATGPAAVLLNHAAAEDPALGARLDRLGSRIAVTRHRVGGVEETEAEARRAATRGAAAVIAAGGDGSLHAVVNGVLGRGSGPGPAIAVLPYGTGNDFARLIGLDPAEPAAVLDRLTELTPVVLDVARVNDRWFINLVTGGKGPAITAQTPRGIKALLGELSYVVFGAGRIASVDPPQLALTGPGLSWSGRANVLSVGNGRTAGGGFALCPAADLDDGMLDVMVIPELAVTDMPTAALEYAQLPRDRPRRWIRYWRVDRLTVQSPKPLLVHADGEPIRASRFDFSVRRRGLRVLAPALPCRAPWRPECSAR